MHVLSILFFPPLLFPNECFKTSLPPQVRAQQAAALRKAINGAARGPARMADRDLQEAVERGVSANPMMRNLTDAAPQEGDLSMRSGRIGDPEDQATRQFKVTGMAAVVELSVCCVVMSDDHVFLFCHPEAFEDLGAGPPTLGGDPQHTGRGPQHAVPRVHRPPPHRRPAAAQWATWATAGMPPSLATSPWRARSTGGTKSTSPASPSTSTACTLATSGTGTIRPTMTLTTRHPRRCRATNLTFSTQTSSTRSRHPHTTWSGTRPRLTAARAWCGFVQAHRTRYGVCTLAGVQGCCASEMTKSCLTVFLTQDIAFRVVNKEWEYNHKKGFVSTFERGILQLYFNFKRQRYRR